MAQKQFSDTEGLDRRTQTALAKRGYEGITARDIFNDCVKDQSDFKAADLLESAYPVLARQSRTFIPVYRYLKEVGIDSLEALETSKLEGAKKIVKKMRGASFATASYKARFDQQFSGLSTQQIIDAAGSARDALLMLPFQPEDEVEIEVMRQFLIDNFDSFPSEPYSTGFKKLICRYDKIAFGF